MKAGTRAALFFFSIIGIGLCGGCESIDSPNRAAASGTKFFVVKVDSAPFYHLGPNQFSGPDLTLPKDTMVTLVRPSFGWSKVRLASGDEGYVSNDDFKIASSAAIAAVNAPPAVKRSNRIQTEPDSSRFTVPEPPLPQIEPTPIPVP